MMRNLAIATVATLAITGLGVVPAAADGATKTVTKASANTNSKRADASAERRKRCVTKREFRRVKVRRHQKMRRVHRIFDTRGKQTYVYTIGGTRYVGREYRACHHPRWSMVTVDFKRGRVDGKFAYWG